MRSTALSRLTLTACALCAWPGCTDLGLVGRVNVCEAGVCGDGSAGDAVITDDVGPDAQDERGGQACRARYAECKLANLEALAYEVCVRDALECGAISEEQAIADVCSARLGVCLRAGGLVALQCPSEEQRCQMNPWGDGGALAPLAAGN